MSEARVQGYSDSGNRGENLGKERATEGGDLHFAYKLSLNPHVTPALCTYKQNSKEPRAKQNFPYEKEKALTKFCQVRMSQ